MQVFLIWNKGSKKWPRFVLCAFIDAFFSMTYFYCGSFQYLRKTRHTPFSIIPLYANHESTVCYRISVSRFLYFDWEIRVWKLEIDVYNGFRTVSWNGCHGSILILWSFHKPLNAEVSYKEGYLVSELYSTPCSFIITRSVTSTWCCLNHRNYIHIQHMYHTPCTHQRHLIPHSHESVNNVLLIGDGSENIDRAIKRLDITIRFASFSVMNILLLYGSGVG